jgi:hypothetical protein
MVSWGKVLCCFSISIYVDFKPSVPSTIDKNLGSMCGEHFICLVSRLPAHVCRGACPQQQQSRRESNNSTLTRARPKPSYRQRVRPLRVAQQCVRQNAKSKTQITFFALLAASSKPERMLNEILMNSRFPFCSPLQAPEFRSRPAH